MKNYLYQNWDLLAIGVVTVMTVLMGFRVYFANKNSVTNKSFLGLTLFTAIWGILNYLSYQSQFIIQAFDMLRFTVFAVTWLLFFFFIFSLTFPEEKTKGPKMLPIIFFILTLVVSILTLTPFVFEKVGEISTTGTITSVINGPLLPIFGITTTGFALAGMIIFLIRTLKRKGVERKKFLFMMAGVIFMFLAIMVSNFILPVVLNNSSYIPIAVLFVFPFIILTTYTIVKNNIFNVKIFGTEVFIVLLLLLTLFQFIQAPDLSTVILRGGIFISLLGVGVLLIRSVMREVEQREELAKLNIDLRVLIKQRESLMHLINHKVKGSFTHSKYIFAGMLDGTFGEINEEIKKRAQQGLDSDNGGIATVDLILNASNLQSGTIKYDMQKIDFKDIVTQAIEGKKISIETKKLQLETNLKDGNYAVLGDANWLKEAVSNLIENSIRYTKEGKITINLETQNGKILVSVKDTGIGISDEDKKNLFTEGGRGKDSVKVNTDSTGYGLYSVRLIVEAHKGRVWAESDGPNTGSTFFIELSPTE